MPIITPAGVKSRGNVKVIMLTTVAVETTIKMTEISAGTSLDLSGYLTPEGWAPDATQSKGTGQRRLASLQMPEQGGDITYTFADLVYMFDPQGAALSNGVKAYEALTPGLTRYFVVRHGLDATLTDFAIGQFAALWKGTLGVRSEVPDLGNEFGEFTVRQTIFGPVGARLIERSAIVA